MLHLGKVRGPVPRCYRVYKQSDKSLIHIFWMPSGEKSHSQFLKGWHRVRKDLSWVRV